MKDERWEQFFLESGKEAKIQRLQQKDLKHRYHYTQFMNWLT